MRARETYRPGVWRATPGFTWPCTCTRSWLLLLPDIMSKAAAKDVTIHLPVDFVCGSKFAADAEVRTVSQEVCAPSGMRR